MHSLRIHSTASEKDVFLLREDSGVWSSTRESREPQKLLRFASTTSVASDKEEPLIPPPRSPRSRYSLFLPIFLAINFLGLALWLQPLPAHPLSSFRLIFSPPSPPHSLVHSAEGGSIISPALKAAVEELVVATICSEQKRPLPDYALKANGGRIALPLTSGHHHFMTSRDDDPSIVIDDDVHAGRCWAFSTLPSQVGVRLSRMLRPSHVSVEHLPRDVVIDIGQAPRNMTLWGIVDGKNNTEIFKTLASNYTERLPPAPPLSKGFLWAALATFSYDIDNGKTLQTFPIFQEYVDSEMSFGVIVLEVLDNWGSDTTCLYRMRIHGTPV